MVKRKDGVILIVIVAEKPDIAKAISVVLSGSPVWQSGYIEQGDYIITWCYGHLLRLKDPEDYGEQYKRENTPNSSLPIFFENWGLKVIESSETLLKNGTKPPDKKAQLDTIGRLLKKANMVIIAGDIDDEGQLLIEEVLEWHNYTGICKRLDTGALNEASLKKAMANLMDNDSWHIKAVSARARSISDFILGINGSRFFSNLYNTNLSVGRVQTATLGLVVARDAQIEGYSSIKHFALNLTGEIDGYGIVKARFQPNENNSELTEGKILNKQYLESLAAKYVGKTISSIIKKEQIYEVPPLPLSISTLKGYCSERFNIAPEETLQITQSLRMNYGGLITYNRSECRYLPENMHIEAPNICNAVFQNFSNTVDSSQIDTTIKSKAFSDKNVGVHHAIIPTDTVVDITKLSQKEYLVYQTICQFYLIQFMPSARKMKTTIEIPASPDGVFSASSVEITDYGFRKVLETRKDNYSNLSSIPQGNYDIKLKSLDIAELETKPPKRYTDSSLETDMKNVAKYVSDPQVKELLLLKDKESKDEHGSIGTAATRSAIIAVLKKRGFLKNDGKQVISTQLGREFYNLLPDEIRKPDVTAKWWAIQQAIQDGDMTPEDMYKDVLDVFKKISSREYPKISLSEKKQSTFPVLDGCVCPRCKSPIIETSKAFGCSGYKSGCKFVLWKFGQHGVYKVLSDNKKKLTNTMAKTLISGKSVTLNNLVSLKTGNTYSAKITMKDTQSFVTLEMNFDIGKKKKGNQK